MIIKKVLIVLFTFITTVSIAQKDEVLFRVNGEPIKTSEFLRIYNKNLSIVTDNNQKDIKNYLDLYVNYKLKIVQAKELGYDTISSYKKELSTYKKQLMEPYLRDDAFINNLVKEAYSRSLVEINASHILVMLESKSIDTLQANSKISEARVKILEGDSFEEIAKQYSEDRSVSINGGNLGYFSVFDMVYPFENAVYNTKKGDVSPVFKTRFGYHIIKVNDIRDARGDVESAHIMLKGDSLLSQTRINDIYNKIVNGKGEFEQIAKTQSEDDITAKKGGSLGKFGSGKMVKEFEDVSFSLENEGDISKPFKTQYGWHIIKLIKKYPIKTFEEQQKELTNKVKRGDRASLVSNSIVYKIKDDYTIEVNELALKPFELGEWTQNSNNLKDELLTIDGIGITQDALVIYLKGKDFTPQLFEKFKNHQILEYYKSHLEETNQEFADIYQEYKEGLLLFELLQKRIWDKSKDTIAVQAYYDEFKSNYSKPLEEIKGLVLNDYQDYLEVQWIEELHNTYKVIINEKRVNKLIEDHK